MKAQENSPKPLLNEFDVATMANVSVGTIRRWRLEGIGPKYRKLGAAVRYKLEDLYAWIDSRPGGGE